MRSTDRGLSRKVVRTNTFARDSRRVFVAESGTTWWCSWVGGTIGGTAGRNMPCAGVYAWPTRSSLLRDEGFSHLSQEDVGVHGTVLRFRMFMFQSTHTHTHTHTHTRTYTPRPHGTARSQTQHL